MTPKKLYHISPFNLPLKLHPNLLQLFKQNDTWSPYPIAVPNLE